jgi:ATP-binding cassette, subfamily B, multidrug efflux pump
LATATVNEQQPMRRIADLRWLVGFVMRHRWSALAAFGFGMIGGVTTALEPYLVGVIIDDIRAGVEMTEIYRGVAMLVGLAAITVFAFFMQRYFSGIVAYSVHYEVRKTVFDNLVELDNDFYKQNSTGDLISRMFSDLNWVWRLLALTFMRSGSAIMGFIMTFILLGLIDLRLTAVVFVTLALSTTFQMWAGLKVTPLSERVQDQAGVLSSLVQDTVSGIQTVKTFGRERYVNRKFYEENMIYKKRWLHFKRMNEPVGMLPQMISYLTNGVVVLFGGYMTLSGQITLGNFTQFILYLSLISRVMLQIGTIYQRYVQTRGAFRRVTPLLQEASIKDNPAGIDLPHSDGNITFENVTLREGDKTILRDINLTIPGGSVVGLVGATGAGKTMLVNLLSRVTDVDEGRVLVDGIDVRDLKLKDLRQAIAYVPQTTFLFSQALQDNIRMGRDEMSAEEIDRAVSISRVSNDLDQMPDGLQTLVGEKGVMLSGGQKQRVAIARAIARNPSILVLDDAMSSVDTQTAAEILTEMRQVLSTRTSIIIAHRIATVKDSDIIIVMDNGTIAEQGTHEELIEQGGLYASMVDRESQQEGELLS